MPSLAEEIREVKVDLRNLRQTYEEDYFKLRQIATDALLLSYQNAKSIRELSNEMRAFKDEMKAFKDGMLVFKDEMLAFKDEMKAFKDEMLAFKNEMKAFKDEMLAFKDEMKAFKDEMLAFKDEMKAFKDEMLAFKNEMKTFKDEMLAFKDEMKVFKDEMKVFKDEMKIFKDEMLAFKDEMRVFKDEINRKWGELANRLGTLAEDIFAPGVPHLVKGLGFRVRKRMLDVEYKKDGLYNQYDVVVVAEDEAGRERVFVAEVKSQLRAEHFPEFREKLERLPLHEPAYEGKIVPVLAAFRIPEDLVSLASRRGVLLVRMGGEYLEPLNPEVVKRATEVA